MNKCPIARCLNPVSGPMRICAACYRYVPIPQREALGHYAKSHKGGPAHQGAFIRAVRTIEAARAANGKSAVPPVRQVTTPYRDD